MQRRLALFSLVIATISASSVFSTTASDAGASGAELCFGQVPTIVGTPGQEVVGTEGPDVVVTNGAKGADTLGGDDLLCITGMSHAYFFRTGSGSDRVDSSASQSGWTLDIVPGPGPDEVVGGPADERVHAGAMNLEDLLGDTISTAGGDDYVSSGGDVANHDVIDLGPGRDVAKISPLKAADAVLRGGPGRDTLRFVPLRGFSGDWLVNNRGGQAIHADELALRWSSFSAFALRLHANVIFLGSSIDETLDLQYPNQPGLHRRARVDLRMGGGDDTLITIGGSRNSRYDGGTGNDTYRNPPGGWGEGEIWFDLAAGTFRHHAWFGLHTKVAINFENATIVTETPITLLGTDGPNRLGIESTYYAVGSGVIYGRGGADVLNGGRGADLLLGGQGSDTAFGSTGVDRCVAEVRDSCER